jgi:hypothetical protein
MMSAAFEMMRIIWISKAAGGVALATLLIVPAVAAEAQPKASAAFGHYVQLTEARLDADLQHDDRFLWVDSLPATRRQAELTRLKRGEIILGRLETRALGQPIEVPDGMIHHWIATVYLPGVGLDRVVPILQDYDRHAQLFAPAVVRSKLRSRVGDDFKMYLRLTRTKVLTVVLDTENDVHYTRPGPSRVEFRARSTSVREVEDAGTPRESIKPPGEGRGFMRRLNTYGRLEERDGGTIVQFETVSLSRDIPFGLGWLIGPFVTSVPKESLVFTLETLRSRVPASASNGPLGQGHS